MKQVTKEEFFARINAENLDVQPRIISDLWPYTQNWEFRKNSWKPLYGKTVTTEKSKGVFVNEYFLNEEIS